MGDVQMRWKDAKGNEVVPRGEWKGLDWEILNQTHYEQKPCANLKICCVTGGNCGEPGFCGELAFEYVPEKKRRSHATPSSNERDGSGA
jgi:hypothetical protein